MKPCRLSVSQHYVAGYFRPHCSWSVANYVSVFGFLAGSVAASTLVYYYVLGEYKIANEMLSDDISVGFTASKALSLWRNSLCALCAPVLMISNPGAPNGHDQTPVIHHRTGVESRSTTQEMIFLVQGFDICTYY